MIRHFIHLVSLLCLLPVITYGQWIKASSGGVMPFSSVWEITTFYDHQNVFNILAAAGTAGAYRSTDKGLNWIGMNSGLSGSTVISIAAVPGTQSPPILLAGTYQGAYSPGRILRSTNYGVTWTTVLNTGTPGTYTGCFTYYPDGTGGWNIFAGFNYVYKSTNNGVTWIQTDVSQPKSLIALPDGSGGTNIFAGTQSTIYKSTDNGSTWFNSSTGLPSSAVWGLAWLNNTLFAATMGGMFNSTDNGLTWSPVSSTSSLSFSRLFEAEGKLYAGTFLSGLYVSTDSGVSWFHANGVPNGFRLSALAAIPYAEGKRILAGFESGSNLYISVNDTTWEIFGNPELGRVYCLHQDDQYIFAVSLQDVFYSADIGDSWRSIGSGLPPADYCAFATYRDSSGGRYLFAGAVNGNHLICRSTDMGAHWVNVSNESAYDLALITGESGVNLFCANYWGVLCSTDNGDSWINKSNGIVSYIETLFAEGSGASARIYAGGQQGKLYYSTNYGDNWNQLTPVSGTIISLLVFGDTIFVGTYESLFFSTDHGSSWISAHNGLPSTAINSLILIPRGVENQIAVGTRYEGVFVSTTGTSWIPVNDGLPPQCEVLSLILKDSTVFAGTGNGVWKRPLYQMITSTGIKEIDVILEYTLGQNYPNPFNPSTTITYSIPEAGKVSLTVYDALGRVVSKLLDEEKAAGNYKVDFNAEGLASGIYFYQLRASDILITKKMMMVK